MRGLGRADENRPDRKRAGDDLGSWSAVLAASRLGKISTLASPWIREAAITRWRAASDSAVSACISPSTSSSGARSPIRRRALRILRAEGVSAEPKSECEISAIFGSMPKRRLMGAGDRRFGDLLRVRVVAHMGVGEEIDARRR